MKVERLRSRRDHPHTDPCLADLIDWANAHGEGKEHSNQRRRREGERGVKKSRTHLHWDSLMSGSVEGLLGRKAGGGDRSGFVAQPGPQYRREERSSTRRSGRERQPTHEVFE